MRRYVVISYLLCRCRHRLMRIYVCIGKAQRSDDIILGNFRRRHNTATVSRQEYFEMSQQLQQNRTETETACQSSARLLKFPGLSTALNTNAYRVDPACLRQETKKDLLQAIRCARCREGGLQGAGAGCGWTVGISWSSAQQQRTSPTGEL